MFLVFAWFSDFIGSFKSIFFGETSFCIKISLWGLWPFILHHLSLKWKETIWKWWSTFESSLEGLSCLEFVWNFQKACGEEHLHMLWFVNIVSFSVCWTVEPPNSTKCWTQMLPFEVSVFSKFAFHQRCICDFPLSTSVEWSDRLFNEPNQLICLRCTHSTVWCTRCTTWSCPGVGPLVNQNHQPLSINGTWKLFALCTFCEACQSSFVEQFECLKVFRFEFWTFVLRPTLEEAP